MTLIVTHSIDVGNHIRNLIRTAVGRPDDKVDLASVS